MNKGLKWVSILTTIGMFIVLVMGALVTKTGSADGCGNTWPLCHGKFAPLASLESLIEYNHRLVSGIVGLLVAWQSIWAWRKLGHVRGVKFFAFFGFFLTFAQALLGAAAVMWGQSSAVLALHFGLSLTAFASVLLLTILVYETSWFKEAALPPVSTGLKIGIWSLTIYCYIVVYLGAFVRHTQAFGCYAWPKCTDQWIPALTGPAGFQVIHRIAAFLFLVFMVGVTVYMVRKVQHRKDLVVASILSLVLTIGQVLSGAYVVLTGISLFPSLLHNMIISALFGVLCYLCFQSLDQKQKTGEGLQPIQADSSGQTLNPSIPSVGKEEPISG
ncbi:hypothetical protein BEP19_01780 [Ammoniphilus oxalaticus]|uniref:Heme A synthase n=1 Tax=Ammoniphilus oxalaticus TaxID=66863 RepID=A0A419SN40_9BACL|nr:heme A synthase [Ammoniphilus oxalaticus]RKD25695.1 hypothetical protein BEP19_01780 [Ammoniphilus oxalaticus]